MHSTTMLLTIALVLQTPTCLEYTCSSETEQCSAKSEFKYLFFDVSNQEGFNLRRDVYMRYAIMFAEMQKRNERLNWKLVLPPFYRIPHWRTETSFSIPIPWSKFFDIKSLKSYAPVVEVHEVFKNKLPYMDIDRIYILQNYENAFENGLFAEKWDVLGKCDYRSHIWTYTINTIETVCVRFQGKVSKLWEFISLHPYDKSVMIYHAEIPLHDVYGTKSYWDCRKSMKFNDALIKIAMEYIEKYLNCSNIKCDNYIGVHWRRGDFARSRSSEVPSIDGTAKQISEVMKKQKFETKNVFVATDADATEKMQLQKALKAFGLNTYFFTPRKKDISTYRDGGIAIIEQIICSHAAYFIGSHESTFTYRIQEEREIVGFNTSLTFNRLCPDKGRCEEPSVWNIIH